MRAFQILLGAVALGGTTYSTCFSPEPANQICYNTDGATAQNIDLKDVKWIAGYLRHYENQQKKQGKSPFHEMPVDKADNCAEWTVAERGNVMVLAKLVGERDAAVTFSDIASTIHSNEKSLVNCGTAGGQMGVIVDKNSDLYKMKEFTERGFTTEGIVIKIVREP
ncbi:hypothetical protein HIM_10770 [Hirsutella minnesotensis 3608]|uniref:Ecp2 effector protein domain-containing protein n=1 Tax=Hirsutella minnesotensis 3608 TaxID=1043627 RepID=A0A0F7ZWZ7_9HYPO|nr:hypothetical protein HIM_10770 [Hirsutella minnesotensis 3608]